LRIAWEVGLLHWSLVTRSWQQPIVLPTLLGLGRPEQGLGLHLAQDAFCTASSRCCRARGGRARSCTKHTRARSSARAVPTCGAHSGTEVSRQTRTVLRHCGTALSWWPTVDSAKGFSADERAHRGRSSRAGWRAPLHKPRQARTCLHSRERCKCCTVRALPVAQCCAVQAPHSTGHAVRIAPLSQHWSRSTDSTTQHSSH
jgi:hypothetical protein